MKRRALIDSGLDGGAWGVLMGACGGIQMHAGRAEFFDNFFTPAAGKLL